MSVFAGPEVTESGLVLSYDAGNYKNSYSSVSTNIIVNGSFSGGTGIPGEADSNPTNEIVQVKNPGESPFVLRQTGNYTEYQLNYTTQLVANTTYVMSGWYAKTADYNGGDTMFHARAMSTSGNHIATGTDTGTLIRSTVIDGITWEYRYMSITTPVDYSNTFAWFVGYGAVNTTGYRYYTNLKLERGTFPSLVNMAGNYGHGLSIVGPTYSSLNGGSFTFNGSSNIIAAQNSTTLDTQTPTVEVWVKTNALSQYGFWFEKGEVNTQYSLFQEAGNIIWRQNIGGVTNLITTTSTYMSTSSWYQVVGTYTSGTRRLYINGTLVNSDTQTGTIATNAGGMSIGVYGGFAGANGRGYYYNGSLSICRVYNRALSATEVAQNFNALRGRYGI